MHRFYLPPESCREGVVSLSPRESHHAAHVLRLRPGEEVLVLDGHGREFHAAARPGPRGAVDLEIRRTRVSPPPQFEVTLLQAIPRGKTFDTIIQKATELGVARIVPLVSDRTVAQPDPADAASKQGRWQSVAVEAIKQCGSLWLPKLEAPATPEACIARAEPCDLALVASLRPGSGHPRCAFEAFSARAARRPRSVAVWVGPEGDFTPAELDRIESSGAVPISLGELVLRAETAALYCLSVIQYELRAP